MYQALYRKYRPRTFSEVVGQEHITDTLKNQVASGRLSHAYMFIGTRGTGKTTCAKILAKAVNCENPVDGDPCGVCASCRGIDNGSIMDVVEIDAASNNSVDSVRQLREEAIFAPASVKKRVYIIDEAHMLSNQAWNALLKIIEEPPEHLVFIFATTELRKVPPTILSRCQRYSFRRVSPGVLASRLNYIAEKEGLDLRPDAADLLARLGDGSFRDGISLLDQCSGAGTISADTVLSSLGLAGNMRVAEMLRAVSSGNTAGALELFNKLWTDGKDPAGLLSDLCSLMRDLLLMNIAPKGGAELITGGYDAETLRSLGKAFTAEELLRNMQRIQETTASMRDNPSPKTAAELCLATLCRPKLIDGLPELRARVSRLEERPAAAPVPAEPVCAAVPETPDIPEPRKESAPEPPPPPETEPDRFYQVGFGPESPADAEEPPPFADAEPPEEEGLIRAEETEERVPEPEPFDDEEPGFFPPEAEQAGSAGDKCSWDNIRDAVKPRMAVGFRNLLDDPLLVNGSVEGDTLVLSMGNGFAASMLNKADILAMFREEATALAGRNISVKVTEMNSADEIAEQIGKRNIEELARFKGVIIK